MKKLISAILTATIIATSVPMISYANESTDVMSDYNAVVSEYDAGKRFIGGLILTEDSDEVMIDDMTVSCDEKVTIIQRTIQILSRLKVLLMNRSHRQSRDIIALM